MKICLPICATRSLPPGEISRICILFRSSYSSSAAVYSLLFLIVLVRLAPATCRVSWASFACKRISVLPLNLKACKKPLGLNISGARSLLRLGVDEFYYIFFLYSTSKRSELIPRCEESPPLGDSVPSVKVTSPDVRINYRTNFLSLIEYIFMRFDVPNLTAAILLFIFGKCTSFPASSCSLTKFFTWRDNLSCFSLS